MADETFTDLTPAAYAESLAPSFIPLADELRDMLTEFGLRPYRVRQIIVQWSSGTRGEGQPTVIAE